MMISNVDYTITDLDSEILVDQRCSALLKQFHQQLIEQQFDPLLAGKIAHGADYFLRDFIIGDCRENPLTIQPERVRQFAGHWYIIKTLEPNLKELTDILQGIALFYSYLLQKQAISVGDQQHILQLTAELDFYQQRIDDFWSICADGYQQWRDQCPLPNTSAR